MDERDHRIIEFERLNLLGKTVYVTGATARAAADLLDKVIDRAADIVAESERAFKQGRDPNVDDARILEEREQFRPKPRPPLP